MISNGRLSRQGSSNAFRTDDIRNLSGWLSTYTRRPVPPPQKDATKSIFTKKNPFEDPHKIREARDEITEITR